GRPRFEGSPDSRFRISESRFRIPDSRVKKTAFPLAPDSGFRIPEWREPLSRSHHNGNRDSWKPDCTFSLELRAPCRRFPSVIRRMRGVAKGWCLHLTAAHDVPSKGATIRR